MLTHLPAPDEAAAAQAAARNAQLTKPAGSLGRLESLALWYASWRGCARPRIQNPQIIVFAGNHGVAAQGVSAFPAEVSAQMVANFQQGGAAINQLAAQAGARLDVHALSLGSPVADFTQAPAMSAPACLQALHAGWCAVAPSADLLVVGEMGIGNTTAAAAMVCALFGGAPSAWVGRGTGVDDAGLAQKQQAVERGVARLCASVAAPSGLEVLRQLGGREIAAMAGGILRARMLRIPVILDGFVCAAAAACLQAEHADALDHAVAGHLSAESAHAAVLARLGKEPLLSLGMRLGEASGGALAIPILKSALACHSGMASFAEAGVAH